MAQSVKKLMLFTLSACPMGRSMNTVIRELVTRRKELVHEVVYVDVDHETTNRYRIKTNPTTLFLDGGGAELYRLEGFRETEEVWNLLRRIEEGALRSEPPREENRETAETYTIYLYQNGRAVPVETTVINKTSVKAPRITAIRQLLRTRPEGYDNSFPPDASLERVSFHGNSCVVTLRSAAERSGEETDRMKILLAQTLAVYGISDIRLEWVND